jgi:hypothetical protein
MSHTPSEGEIEQTVAATLLDSTSAAGKTIFDFPYHFCFQFNSVEIEMAAMVPSATAVVIWRCFLSIISPMA